MEQFVLHPELVEQMGKASYEYCKEKFDVKKVNEDMLKHLNIV